MHGIILAWYLPGILSGYRQVRIFALSDYGRNPDISQNAMFEARETLRPLLEVSRSGSSWREDPELYPPGGEGLQGSVNLSPAWFQQAHDVSISTYTIYFRQLIQHQKISQECPQPSANFRSPAALKWLDSIPESNAVLSAILAVIHPQLYEAGRQTIERLRSTPEIEDPEDLLSRWASVFSGVSVISNRYTPPHRDQGSRYHWYDILATSGCYRNCDLKLPGLGITLEYGPGTVVGLAGKVLEHEVSSFKGDRVCYAYFMRNNVHDWANVPASEWMYAKEYE